MGGEKHSKYLLKKKMWAKEIEPIIDDPPFKKLIQMAKALFILH